jgi:hypothetical protein
MLNRLVFTLLLLVLLSPLHPSQAQGTLKYQECGGEEYLIERYYLLQQDDPFSDAITEDKPSPTALMSFLVATWGIRDEFLTMDEETIPECVKELHKLSVHRQLLFSDLYTMVLFVNNIGGEVNNYTFVMQEMTEDIDDINSDIDNILLDLEWIDIYYNFTNEPPPREE